VLPQGRGSLEPIGSIVDVVNPDGGWASHERTWIVAMDYDSGRRTVFGRRDGAPAAALRDAVMASCAIPGWYTPVRIAGRRYVDGGACSPTSLDLVAKLGLDEVVVLSPMTSLRYDAPTAVAARIERRFRRIVTKRLVGEVKKVAATGTKVTLLGPGTEDLEVIGANMMDPRRREQVLETSLRTSRDALRADALAQAG
jgi:NTE family protein